MTGRTLLCRSATTFSADGRLDLDAYGLFLQRFLDARLGLYLCSAGSGESHTMSRDEIRTIYETAVALCRGRIPVNANPPEQHTAAATLDHSLLAAQAGVEVVNIYGPAGWHGYAPTDEEFTAFYDQVLRDFPHRAAVAPNPVIGYTPSAAAIARLCARHTQIEAINLAGLDEAYFMRLRDALTRDVAIYVPLSGSMEALALGAAGLVGAEANVVPNTFRLYLDAVEAGDTPGAAVAYADLLKVTAFLKRWHSGSPRWIKMFFKAFKLPGDATLREPYRMPGAAELQDFAQGLVALGVPEITAQAERAGLAVR